MGSRIRNNPLHIFECFCEVAIPQYSGEQAFILQKYPDSYALSEVLKCVPQFAYPCVNVVDTVTHFSFVLTNIESKWTFGFCRHAPKSQTCIVMLSYLPWHSTFFRILNQCAELTNRNAAYLYRFLDSIYTCDVPQPGLQLSVSYCTDNKVYEFNAQCPDHHKIPSIPEDRNLTEYFNAIDITNMIVIFANMLNERRIIVTSRKLSRLSACVQAANSLIYPMHWQHIFIPVLPHHLTDYLSAPMPFLIGVPSVIMNRVKRSELGDIVILDADENKIDSPFDDVHMLPVDIVHSLKKSLRNPVSMLGDGVARSFLRALVMLIGGYRDALRFTSGQKITFNYEAFVATRSPSIQSFLEKMLQLQIFRQFIEGRLEMLNDGEGFSDEFEFELNMYEDKNTHRLKTQYREWLGAMRKEGGAILKSVNPAVKSAYKQVKDKGKQAYKDLRSKMQNNTPEKISATDVYDHHRPSSVPSSPVLALKPVRSIKKSMSGTGIAKTDRTITYVREAKLLTAGDKCVNYSDSDTNKLYNGFIVATSNGFSSLSRNRLAPEASPEASDVDSDYALSDTFTINRIEIDLMGELKDILYKRSSMDETSSSKSSNSQESSSSLTITNNNSANNSSFNLIAKPIPPPRNQLNRKPKPPVVDSREAPLIELDTPPEDIDDKNTAIFDPLFEIKKADVSREKPLITFNSNSNWSSSSTATTSPKSSANANNFNTLTQLMPNNSLCSSSLASSHLATNSNTNTINPFMIEKQAKASETSVRAVNYMEIGGQTTTSTTYNAQNASALSLTNTNQTTNINAKANPNANRDMMINWSLSHLTNQTTNANLSKGSLVSVSSATDTQQTNSSNPFKTANWQHFD